MSSNGCIEVILSSSTLAESSPIRRLEFGALSSHFDISLLRPNVTSPRTSGTEAELANATKLYRIDQIAHNADVYADAANHN